MTSDPLLKYTFHYTRFSKLVTPSIQAEEARKEFERARQQGQQVTPFVFKVHVLDYTARSDATAGAMDNQPILDLNIRENVVLEELLKEQKSDKLKLRMIFCDDDKPNWKTMEGLTSLYLQHKVSGWFVQEIVQGVTHSFGSYDSPKSGTYQSWLHFLCKHIRVRQFPPGGWRTYIISEEGQGADYTWVRAAFYVHRDVVDNTMLVMCFGHALDDLRNRFQEMVLNQEMLAQVLADPVGVYVEILDDLYVTIDQVVWNMTRVTSTVEEELFELAKLTQEQALLETPPQSFVKLHNIAKHVCHLMESTSAMSLTVKKMITYHESWLEVQKQSGSQGGITPGMMTVRNKLRYLDGLLESTHMRMISLEKRMNNIINLALHLVAQLDSRCVQKDGKSLKNLSIITFIFLPITTVATIFGSNFFNYDVDRRTGEESWTIAGKFWIFWVFAGLATGLAYGLWLRSKRKLSERYTPQQFAGSA